MRRRLAITIYYIILRPDTRDKPSINVYVYIIRAGAHISTSSFAPRDFFACAAPLQNQHVNIAHTDIMHIVYIPP